MKLLIKTLKTNEYGYIESCDSNGVIVVHKNRIEFYKFNQIMPIKYIENPNIEKIEEVL